MLWVGIERNAGRSGRSSAAGLVLRGVSPVCVALEGVRRAVLSFLAHTRAGSERNCGRLEVFLPKAGEVKA